MESHTFVDWQARGRSVRQGSHADTYLVAPDLKQAVALFREDQTDPLYGTDRSGWFEMPAAEWKEVKAEAKRPKPIIRIRTRTIEATAGEQHSVTSVWVGRNTEATEWLTWAGFSFDLPTHRWNKVGAVHEDVVGKFEGSGKYTVVIE